MRSRPRQAGVAGRRRVSAGANRVARTAVVAAGPRARGAGEARPMRAGAAVRASGGVQLSKARAASRRVEAAGCIGVVASSRAAVALRAQPPSALVSACRSLRRRSRPREQGSHNSYRTGSCPEYIAREKRIKDHVIGIGSEMVHDCRVLVSGDPRGRDRERLPVRGSRGLIEPVCRRGPGQPHPVTRTAGPERARLRAHRRTRAAAA